MHTNCACCAGCAARALARPAVEGAHSRSRGWPLAWPFDGTPEAAAGGAPCNHATNPLEASWPQSSCLRYPCPCVSLQAATYDAAPWRPPTGDTRKQQQTGPPRAASGAALAGADMLAGLAAPWPARQAACASTAVDWAWPVGGRAAKLQAGRCFALCWQRPSLHLLLLLRVVAGGLLLLLCVPRRGRGLVGRDARAAGP